MNQTQPAICKTNGTNWTNWTSLTSGFRLWLVLLVMLWGSPLRAQGPELSLGTGAGPGTSVGTDAGAAPPSMAVLVPSAFYAKDSEGFETLRYGAGLLPLYQHGEAFTGIRLEQLRFRQLDWQAQGQSLMGLHQAIDPVTGLGLRLGLGLTRVGGHERVLTENSYSQELLPGTRLEAQLSRDLVETQAAIDQGVSYTLVGLSLEQAISPSLSPGLVGIVSLGRMSFSDGNQRTLFKGRLVYDLLPDQGVNLQLRYRRFQTEKTDFEASYFNPDHYQELMAVVGLRRRIQGWTLAGAAGLGRQRISTDPSTQTDLLELSLSSPVWSSQFFWRVRAGSVGSAGFQGPSYRYRYLMQELVFPF